MRRLALITIAIGCDPAYRYGLMSLECYAEKIGAELVVIDREIIPSPSHFNLQQRAWLQKVAVVQMARDYDEILYLDSDVLVNPEAPDFFSWIAMEASGASVAMYDEKHLGGREHYVTKFVSLDQSRSATPLVLHGYYNVGVMYLKQDNPLSDMINPSAAISAINALVPCPEQTYFNYLIARHELPVLALPRTYNFMQEGDQNDDRFDNHFIHYAGYSFRRNKKEKRSCIMRDDFIICFERAKALQPVVRHFWLFRDFCLNICFSLSKELAKLCARFK